MYSKVGYTIRTSLKKEFEDLVIRKHGFKKGKCSLELEQAIKNYIAEDIKKVNLENTNSSDQSNENKIMNKDEKLINDFKTKYMNDKKVSKYDLIKLMKNNGLTIEDGIELLKKHRMIKALNQYIFKVTLNDTTK